MIKYTIIVKEAKSIRNEVMTLDNAETIGRHNNKMMVKTINKTIKKGVN